MSNKIKVIDYGDSSACDIQNKQKFHINSNYLNKKNSNKITYTFNYTKDKRIIFVSGFNYRYHSEDDYGELPDFDKVYIEVDPQLVTSINNEYFILLQSTDNKYEDYFEVIEYDGKYFIKLNFTDYVHNINGIEGFSNSVLKLLLCKCDVDIEFRPHYDDNSKKYALIVLFAKFYM